MRPAPSSYDYVDCILCIRHNTLSALAMSHFFNIENNNVPQEEKHFSKRILIDEKAKWVLL